MPLRSHHTLSFGSCSWQLASVRTMNGSPRPEGLLVQLPELLWADAQGDLRLLIEALEDWLLGEPESLGERLAEPNATGGRSPEETIDRMPWLFEPRTSGSGLRDKEERLNWVSWLLRWVGESRGGRDEVTARRLCEIAAVLHRARWTSAGVAARALLESRHGASPRSVLDGCWALHQSHRDGINGHGPVRPLKCREAEGKASSPLEPLDGNSPKPWRALVHPIAIAVVDQIWCQRDQELVPHADEPKPVLRLEKYRHLVLDEGERVAGTFTRPAVWCLRPHGEFEGSYKEAENSARRPTPVFEQLQGPRAILPDGRYALVLDRKRGYPGRSSLLLLEETDDGWEATVLLPDQETSVGAGSDPADMTWASLRAGGTNGWPQSPGDYIVVLDCTWTASITQDAYLRAFRLKRELHLDPADSPKPEKLEPVQFRVDGTHHEELNLSERLGIEFQGEKRELTSVAQLRPGLLLITDTGWLTYEGQPRPLEGAIWALEFDLYQGAIPAWEYKRAVNLTPRFGTRRPESNPLVNPRKIVVSEDSRPGSPGSRWVAFVSDNGLKRGKPSAEHPENHLILARDPVVYRIELDDVVDAFSRPGDVDHPPLEFRPLPTTAGLASPRGLALDENGDLLVTDEGFYYEVGTKTVDWRSGPLHVGHSVTYSGSSSLKSSEQVETTSRIQDHMRQEAPLAVRVTYAGLSGEGKGGN